MIEKVLLQPSNTNVHRVRDHFEINYWGIVMIITTTPFVWYLIDDFSI